MSWFQLYIVTGLMKYFVKQAARATFFAAVIAVGTIPSAQAGGQDYEFQLVTKEFKAGPPAEIAVRLVHKPDGKPVPGAVIFSTRLDMGPDGMEAMTTPVEKVPGGEPGVYRFKAKLSMEGSWAFSLAAKAQGEPDSIKGKLVLKAVP
jgi:hypothetical protein